MNAACERDHGLALACLDVIASSAPMVRDGKLRALAVVGVEHRVAMFPQVPTLGELGHGSLNLLGSQRWAQVIQAANIRVD